MLSRQQPDQCEGNRISIYDNRESPAHQTPWEPEYCDNRYILNWWSRAHDELLIKQIREKQWHWYQHITAEILNVTPPEVVNAWKDVDPLCRRWAWNNILMNFAGARADKLGLTEAIRQPERRTCPLCEREFVEDSLPGPFAERLGFDQLDFCSPCLNEALWAGRETHSRDEALTYLRDLVDVLQRVPSQDFGQGRRDLVDLSTEQRLELLKVLQTKPSVRRIKELFGSWFAALVAAGVLEDGAHRTARGTRCMARDGHVCLSLGEKTVDDLLHAHGIPHEKEPRYPEGKYRADFAVGGVFIEYFGMKGNPDYDKKMKLKQGLCKRHGITLISIYPQDLVSVKRLEGKLLSSQTFGM